MKELTSLQLLKRILDNSSYTVAVSGPGVAEEGGYLEIRNPERAYDLESRYGASPDEIFSGAYYNTRPARFFEFYKNEILGQIPEPGPACAALAAMERAGKLQCIATQNLFEQEQRAGCRNVINLHGSVYENRCAHCGRSYSIRDILNARGIPVCSVCEAVIRPQVTLFGEMVDSRVMTKTTEEIERADVLLVLGATLRSEVFSNYLRYFSGNHLVVIHREEHFLDKQASLVILDSPGNVLQQLKY